MRIGKTYYFEAAHDLPNHEGKCRRLHGHSYKVEVEIQGEESGKKGSSSEGMLLDFDILDKAMDPIIEALDHYYLNDVLGVVTTAENVAAYISRWLINNLKQFQEWDGSHMFIAQIRVWETRKGYAVWP